jgi:hypothetical protein
MAGDGPVNLRASEACRLTWESFPDDSLSRCGGAGDNCRGDTPPDSDRQAPLLRWPDGRRPPSAHVAPRRRRLASGPLNDEEATSLAKTGMWGSDIPGWNRSIWRMTPSEIEVQTKFSLDLCLVFLIAGPCVIDHFLVCFACSPFHKRHRVWADGIAKLPTVAANNLPNLFA